MEPNGASLVFYLNRQFQGTCLWEEVPSTYLRSREWARLQGTEYSYLTPIVTTGYMAGTSYIGSEFRWGTPYGVSFEAGARAIETVCPGPPPRPATPALFELGFPLA